MERRAGGAHGNCAASPRRRSSGCRFKNQWLGVAMGLGGSSVADRDGHRAYSYFASASWGVFASRSSPYALVLLVRLVVIDVQPVTNGFNGLTDLGWFKVGGLEFDPDIVPDLIILVAIAPCLAPARRAIAGSKPARLLFSRRSGTTRTVRVIFGFICGRSIRLFFFVRSLAGTAGPLPECSMW